MEESNHVSVTTKTSTWFVVIRSNTPSVIDNKLQQFKQAILNPAEDSKGSSTKSQWPEIADASKMHLADAFLGLIYGHFNLINCFVGEKHYSSYI